MDLMLMGKKIENLFNCEVTKLLPGIVYRCKNDPDWTMVFMSDKVIDVLGYSLDEVNDITFNKIIFSEDRNLVRDSVNKALARKDSFKLKYRINKKDGEIIWFEKFGRGIYIDAELQFIEGYMQDITDDVVKQQQLQKQIHSKNEAEQLAHLGSWNMDITTGKSWWSDEFYRICGIEPGAIEANAENGFKIIHPDDTEKAAQAIEKAINTKSNYDIDKRIVRPDGEIRHVRSVGNIKTDDQGNPEFLEGYFLDITDLIEKEQQLKIENNRLERAEDIGLTGNWEFDLNTGTVFASTGASKIYELEDRPYTIKEVQEIPLKQYRKQLDGILEKLIEKGDHYRMQFKIKGRKSNMLKTIESVAYYKKEQNLVYGIIKDVTVEIAKKSELEKAVELNKAFFDNDPEMRLSVDMKTGNIINVNHTFLDRTGFQREQIINTSFLNLYHPDSHNKAKRIFNSFIKTGKIKDEEMIAVDVKGNKLIVVLNSNLVRDENKEPYYSVSSWRDITASKMLEKKLDHVELNYKALYNNIPVGVVTFKTDGTLVMINNESASFYGGNIDEMIGKKLWDYMDKEMADSVFSRISDCSRKKKKLSFKDSMEIKNQHFTFLTNYVPIISSEKKVIAVQVSSTNITELEETREKYIKLNERYVIANQAVKNGVWDWNLKTNDLLWDNYMYEIFGVDKADKGRNHLKWESALLEEDIDFAKKEIVKTVKDKGVLDIQFRIRHPLKGVRHIRSFGKYVELDSPHLIGINYDNTERVENRLKLAQSEALFRRLFEQNNDIICILSPSGNIIKMNQVGLSVFGITREQVSDYLFSDFTMSEKDTLYSHEVIEKLRNNDIAQPYHRKFRIKNNQLCDFEVSVSAIYNDAGNLLEIVTILRDISQRIQQENEILRQSEKAKESDRLKSSFLLNMSHEIRTPLNAILGFTEILKGTTLNNVQLGFIGHIQQGGNRLVDAVENILNASLLQQNQIKTKIEELKLKEILNELFLSSKDLYYNQLDDIEFSYHSNSEDEIYINTDYKRLTMVFKRLIDNAFKFTQSGSILLECISANQYVEVNIKDTGSGIEKEKLDVIFDFFRQGDEAITRGYEGLGLGLPIAKGMLNLLGYSIEISSEVNVGTNISIRIPLKGNIKTQSINKQKKTLLRPASSSNILVVEDDIHSGKYLEVLLSPYANKIDIANDGFSCRSLLKKYKYQIALVDIKLPDISGFDLIPLIRKTQPDCRIYIQSAFASQGEIEKAIKLGAEDYFIKPLEKAKLLKIFSDFNTVN